MQPLFISTSFYKISYFCNIPYDHFIKSLAFVTSIKQTHADERLYNFYISFKALIRVEKKVQFSFCFVSFF